MQPPSYSETSEVKKYFEVSIHPTGTFLGRNDVLRQIEAHFKDEAFSEQQKRVAVYGLGGSGKTQLAVSFAFNHKNDYKSVFFINATSTDSLTRDFTRMHQILGLSAIDNDEDKVECVKRWFSRPKNASWLLIFDNADDLEEVDLSTYFPATNFGNILITTRDSRVENPDLTTCALHLDMLSPEDAFTLLLKRAAIKTSLSTDEEKSATQLVNELGFLPLAIDQAGAYIQTRKKKLGDYFQMYQKYQTALLAYRSKLTKHERTVMTTWEMSFEKIEAESPQIAEFLLLLCQYDPSGIPDALLTKGCSPQPVYGQDGELMTLSPEKDLVPESMIRLLGDSVSFDEAVEVLLSFSLVQRRNDDSGFSGFILHPLVQFCGQMRASEEVRKKSLEDAICIASHAYPMGNLDEWHVSFFINIASLLCPTLANHHLRDTSFSQELLPQVEHCCSRLEKARKLGQAFPRIANTGPSLFLAAYHFATISWCERFVTESELLLQNSDDEFLAAFVVERRGKLSPQIGQPERGLEVLSNFVKNPPNIKGDPTSDNPEKRLPHNLANSMHGCVYIMLGHQLMTLGRSEEALKVILSWHALEPSSISERATERYRDRTLADIYVGEKNWTDAEKVLRTLLAPDMRDAASYAGTMGEGWTIHQLAGILLEGKHYKEVNTLTMPAILARQKSGHEDREEALLITMDLICSLLAEKAYDIALFHLVKLRQILEPKFGTTLMVMRKIANMWCLLGRLALGMADMGEAKLCWEKAVEVAEKVTWDNGHMLGAVRFSFGYVLSLMGELDEMPDLKFEMKIVDLEKGRELENVGVGRDWTDKMLEVQKGLGTSA